MSSLADRLRHLLDGDVVELETASGVIRAEVETTDRERSGGAGEREPWRYTIRFMPFGEDAQSVDADRYSVTVQPDAEGGWVVGDLVAEVFVEDVVDYESRPEGEVVDVRKLDARD